MQWRRINHDSMPTMGAIDEQVTSGSQFSYWIMTADTEIILKRLFLFGRPLSPLYSLFMTLRALFYQKGFLKQFALEVPVISVGNLVLGGTGKTPLVQHIAELFLQCGYKPAILSRGYKGTAAGSVNVVSNSSDILLDAATAGDEPRLLAEKLPGVPVITGRKRYATGRFAIDSFGADLLILDDGFQHLALQRNINLLLFNERKGLGNGHVLPGGILREPLSALKRASAFIVSTNNRTQSSGRTETADLLRTRYPEKPLFTAGYQPENFLQRLHGLKNDTITLDAVKDQPLYGFCGIANPDSFKTTLAENGIKLKGFQEFPDHHHYSDEDIQKLLGSARSTATDLFITTEKDLVKLHRRFPPDKILLAQPVRLHLPEEFDLYLTNYLTTILNP